MKLANDDELMRPPGGGRVFVQPMRPGLADCAPSGRIRLDALARWLQDVAYGDVEDAGLEDAAVWVVRRTRIRVERFPHFAERCIASTFCSGIGRMWAERRTTIVPADDDTPAVEAVSLWVHLDPEFRRPAPLTKSELSVYGPLGHDRRVSARLRHPAPPDAVAHRTWRFRTTDCDLADHVNNAAYWQPLEDELLAGSDPERIDAEIEYRSPAQPGEKEILVSGERRWITGADGEVHASVLLLSRAGS
jgi:acyl-ACP thioesterase